MCLALATGEVGQREERKVVTALFCDLVGFTSLSETADPEDVNTMLDAYSTMVRAQIETTAASFRSSSATPWWACSAYRLRTRTTRSGRYGPVFDRGRGGGAGGGGGAPCGCGLASTPARRWYGWT
jgi:hypothetical protein